MKSMNVYFLAGSPTFSKNRQTYEKVFDAIHSEGHTLWPHRDINTYTESVGDGGLDHEDWRVLCDREVSTLHECDAAIFDATDKATFGVGYVAAQALNANKPILLLLREGSLEGSFISGLEHPQLQRAYFNEQNISDLVSTFLGKQVASLEASGQL